MNLILQIVLTIVFSWGPLHVRLYYEIIMVGILTLFIFQYLDKWIIFIM